MNAVTTAPQTVPTFFGSVADKISAPFVAAKNAIAPAVSWVATKVQSVWNVCLPYLQKAGNFMISPLGISLELFAVSAIPLFLAQKLHHQKILSTALLAAGILTAGAGGFFLATSGVIPVPSFLSNVTPVVA